MRRVTISFVIMALGAILAFIFLIYSGSARLDYNSTCLPRGSAPFTFPRCITDLSNVNLYSPLTVLGFSILFIGLYLNRQIKPVFYAFTAFALLLSILAAFFLLI